MWFWCRPTIVVAKVENYEGSEAHPLHICLVGSLLFLKRKCDTSNLSTRSFNVHNLPTFCLLLRLSSCLQPCCCLFMPLSLSPFFFKFQPTRSRRTPPSAWWSRTRPQESMLPGPPACKWCASRRCGSAKRKLTPPTLRLRLLLPRLLRLLLRRLPPQALQRRHRRRRHQVSRRRRRWSCWGVCWTGARSRWVCRRSKTEWERSRRWTSRGVPRWATAMI